MKKRFFRGLVLGAMLIGTLTGCGKEGNVEKNNRKSVNAEIVDIVEVDETTEVQLTTEASADVQASSGADTTTSNVEEGVVYNICESPVYSHEEMMVAADYILNEFKLYFPECELLDITFDDRFSYQQDEMNKEMYGEADYVVFTTTFNVPESYGDGPLNAGKTYEDYQWIMTKNANGQWEIVSCGY